MGEQSKRLRIALFRCVDSAIDLQVILTDEVGKQASANNVRISEWVEVEFPSLPAEDLVASQRAALDQAESRLHAALKRVQAERAKL